MGELVNMAEYRKKCKAKIIPKILDIQLDQLCWSQQSALRRKMAEDEIRKYRWTDWMRE